MNASSYSVIVNWLEGAAVVEPRTRNTPDSPRILTSSKPPVSWLPSEPPSKIELAAWVLVPKELEMVSTENAFGELDPKVVIVVAASTLESPEMTQIKPKIKLKFCFIKYKV